MSKSNLVEHLSWLLSTRPYLPSGPYPIPTSVDCPEPLEVTGFTAEEENNSNNNNDNANLGDVLGTVNATQGQILVRSPPVRRISHTNEALDSPDALAKTQRDMARLQVAPTPSVKSRLLQSTSTVATLTDQYHAQFQNRENGT